MRLCCQCTTWWDTLEQANSRFEGKDSLTTWHENMQRLFKPVFCVLAAGSWSDPRWNKLPCPFVNSGVPKTKPYTLFWWHYAMCAQSAGFFYALNREDWDVLIQCDSDIVFGQVDFNSLLGEFEKRAEILLGCPWDGLIGGPVMAWKREAVWRWAHQRRRANLIDNENGPLPEGVEQEWTNIFKGRYWNPWKDQFPHFNDHMGDAGHKIDSVMKMPFVRMIRDSLRADYLNRANPIPYSN